MKIQGILWLAVLAAACDSANEGPGPDGADPGAETSQWERTDNYQPFDRSYAKAVHEEFEPDFPAWFFRGDDYARYIFLNTSEFWRQSVLTKSGPTRQLPSDVRADVASLVIEVKAGDMTLADYVADSPTDGVVVLHRGKIVFEDYPRMQPGDAHIWFSVSKTFVSTAVAILEDEGKLDAANSIDTYLTVLKGTAWEGIRIVDILDMTSGIDCQELHSDLNSCFWRFYDGFGWPRTDRVSDDPYAIYQEMGRLQPPGEEFDYTSINTELLALLVEEVSGTRFSDFIEQGLWSHVGAESDAAIISTPRGNAFSAGGVNSTLRDMARYGLLFTPSGRGDNAVVSDRYLEKIRNGGRPQLTVDRERRRAQLGDDSFLHNSYQWDIVTDDGDFYKGGAGGQGLYVSPDKDLVIVWFGTHREEGGGTEMLRAARQIATSDLFGGE